ncbi:MAG TPA: hypothetical protein VLX92_20275 [Kofleriaceae bacterium]|nr:hypothetical protein [Kofleriaceae bacterium]
MRALVVLVVLGVAARSARGDVDPDELVARIDDTVHAIATAIEDATAKPKGTGLEDALARSREVRDLVAQLAPVKAGNDRAGDIVAHYPGYADATDAAIARLKDLRVVVRRADGIPDRCAKDDAELHAAIARAHAHPDPDPTRDLAKLSATAQDYGKKWTATLDELAGVDRTVAADVTALHLGLTDGYWMKIAGDLDAAAQALASDWTEHDQAVTDACEELGHGDHHADLVPVLAALHERAAGIAAKAATLVADYNAWLKSVRALRELALKGRDTVRDAGCTTREEDVADRVENVADAWSREVADEVTAVNAAAAALRTRAADHAVKAPPAIADGLRTNLAIVDRIAQDDARGRHNPKLHAAIVATRRSRDDAAFAAGCTYTDLEVAAADCHGEAGAGCRVACVKAVDHACAVIELAADTDHAREDGTTRGGRDLAGLRAWYARDKAGLFARYPAIRRCENADRTGLELASGLESYAACATLSAGPLGEPLPDVSPDLAAP